MPETRTVAQASDVAKALNDILKSNPTPVNFQSLVKADKRLAKFKNVVSSLPGTDPTLWKAVIFSKRFYSNQTADWAKRKKGKAGATGDTPTRAGP